MKKHNKILVNKKSLTNSLVQASFFIFFFSISLYVYINITTVFALINYKKSSLEIETKNQNLANIENEINEFKYKLTLDNAKDFNLSKINTSKFIVRKDDIAMFSVNYEIRRE